MLNHLVSPRRIVLAAVVLLVIAGVIAVRLVDRDRDADDLALRISDPRPGPAVDGTDPGDDGGRDGGRSGTEADTDTTLEAGRAGPVVTTGPIDRSRTERGVSVPRSVDISSTSSSAPPPAADPDRSPSPPAGPTDDSPPPSAPDRPDHPGPSGGPGSNDVPGPSGGSGPSPDPTPGSPSGPTDGPGSPAAPAPSGDPGPAVDPDPSNTPSSGQPVSPSGASGADPGNGPGEDPYEVRARACAELGRSPIGAVRPGVGDPILLGAAERFRLLDETVQQRSAGDPVFDGALVCADPIRRFRNDLVAQQLHVAGSASWTLMAGHAATDPVIVIDELELGVFRWDAPGIVGTRWNVLGVPTGREVVHGLEVIRTTNGAVVMPRSDTVGVPVLGGAWTIWERDGASMGRPVSVPWSEGEGARQSFENGFLTLPAVESPFEALVADASRYEWRPLAGNVIGGPLETNTVVKHDGRSYYVGPDRQLHWIPTRGEWSCATNDLRAPASPEPIDLTLLATLPLGPVFRCSDWK